jgi:hypothetical protein
VKLRIPPAIGDARWVVLVEPFADFLSRLTIRSVLEFFIIAMLAMAFAQTFEGTASRHN